MSWQEKYKELYKKIKAEGKPFFPYAVFKDIVAISIIFNALLLLAHFFGPTLDDPADPTDSTYNPRPEWYFLFLFEALKLFPGYLETIVAVALPVLAVAILFFLPLIDRSENRHPLDRPFFTSLGALVLISISYLTYRGATSPLTNPIIEKDPEVFQGQRLYRDLNCSYCHKIAGRGGTVGPELDKVAGEGTEEWLEQHFRDPQSVTPGSGMPQLNLLDDEIKVLVAYMKSLGGGAPFSPEAPKLFAENCSACHKLGNEGGDLGPDLTLIGKARDKNYIKKYTEDPAKLNPASSMPGYKGQLTETQIQDISRYVASFSENKKP